MNNKIDIAKVAGIVGTVLTIAATLVSGWSQQASITQAAEEAVAKALANQK